jgi:hypothetical protein
MAWFDFLSQPVSGYTQQNLAPQQGYPVDPGGLQSLNGTNTVNMPSSKLTWGQLLGAISSMSNSRSGQQVGGFMSNSSQPVSTASIYQIGPSQSYNQQKQQQSSTGAVVSALASMLIGGI